MLTRPAPPLLSLLKAPILPQCYEALMVAYERMLLVAALSYTLNFERFNVWHAQAGALTRDERAKAKC